VVQVVKLDHALRPVLRLVPAVLRLVPAVLRLVLAVLVRAVQDYVL